MALSEEEVAGITAELAEIPDWGGASIWRTRKQPYDILVPPQSTGPSRPSWPVASGTEEENLAERNAFIAGPWRDYTLALNAFNSESIRRAQFGDLVEWNGAKWMYVGYDPDDETESIWLAPLGAPKKRPEIVEPGTGVLNERVTRVMAPVPTVAEALATYDIVGEPEEALSA